MSRLTILSRMYLNLVIIRTKGPSFERVTIQGISSLVWKNHNSNIKHGTSSAITSTSAASTEKVCENQNITAKSGGNMTDGKRANNDHDDMVPRNLIFEACKDDNHSKRISIYRVLIEFCGQLFLRNGGTQDDVFFYSLLTTLYLHHK